MKCDLPDILCFSHLRWNFVFQRPQHLMTRFARETRVFFVEEPTYGGEDEAVLRIVEDEAGVRILTPHLPAALLLDSHAEEVQRALLRRFESEERIEAPLLWFYTPMALGLCGELAPRLVLYDCMDELSAFLGAPPALRLRETELFKVADVVFTGGQSLYEAKRGRHPNVHAFPSSVDTEHFRSARERTADSPARAGRPRVGFFGVLDERLDLALLEGLARARPNIDFELVGPVVKIDPRTLPQRSNLHYRGPKPYSELPSIIARWDAAMMPFANNPATRFISPTKTLEYMAAGKPVVSTAIHDVVRPYGQQRLVRIADDVASFSVAIDHALAEDGAARLAAFDAFLAGTSWDRTWRRMRASIDAALVARGGQTVPLRSAQSSAQTA